MSKSSESGAESVEGGGRREPGGKRYNQGDELATKVLSIQSKRLYLDVKQNDRGRFIKFAEVAGDGKKSRIFMSMRTSSEFKDLLDTFSDELAKHKEKPESKDHEPAKNSRDRNSRPPHAELLHSENIVSDRRRYYLDLRENSRGRFLKISQSDTINQTRSSIVIPAEGLGQLKSALTELLNEFSEGYMDDPGLVNLPEGRDLRADNKLYYFDPGHNERGDFLKITELKPTFGSRATMTISLKALPQFCEILQDLHLKFGEMRDGEKAVKNEE